MPKQKPKKAPPRAAAKMPRTKDGWRIYAPLDKPVKKAKSKNRPEEDTRKKARTPKPAKKPEATLVAPAPAPISGYNRAFAVKAGKKTRAQSGVFKPAKKAAEAAAPRDPSTGERIAKALSRLGIASRRDAERLINEGRVTVDDAPVTHPAFFVTAQNRITIDGKPAGSREPTRLWRYHKPEGLVTTARDPQGRPTVFASLPANLPRVMSVGRLDIASEGLLLLTNDGALARYLERPQQEFTRRYRVRVHGGGKGVDPARLQGLARGITIDGFAYKGIEARLAQSTGHNAWLEVALTEGKNREIRRVMEALGYPVSRLIRIGFGPFHLGKLAKGAVEEIPARVLKEQLPGFFKEAHD